MNKVLALPDLAARVRDLQAKGKRVVFTNGCFDLLHVGHVRYLRAARDLGDALIVAINGDDSVRALKGEGRPLHPAHDRAEVVAALAAVDFVTIFPEVRATAALEQVRPDIYAKGGDYTPETLHPEERAVLDRIKAVIRIIPFVEGYSTTAIVRQLQAE